ncbi:MAG TPA: TonB family protein [Bryobacteraceae bacterium]|jgi:TonB family protein|nr:TonB family protein [Bryobacteraceae bacterium]
MKKYAAMGAAALAAFLFMLRAQEPQVAFRAQAQAAPPAPAPADAAGLVRAGEAAVQHGQFNRADVYYAQAAALPDSAVAGPALVYLGVKAYKEGDTAGAQAFFQRVLAIDTTSPQAGRALMWMGVIAARNDGAAEAESYYQRALAVEPPASIDAADTLRNYAALLRKTNRTVEAQSIEQRAADVLRQLHQAPQAQTRTLPADVYRTGPGVTPPKLLYKVEPQYTQEARNGGLQGTVVLYVEIGTDGIARNIEVERSLEPGLDEKAIEAVSQWRFSPGMKDGVPATIAANIEVNFRLQ